MTEHNSSSALQTSLLQKVEALNYHNYQILVNPKHKQSDTIKHFKDLNSFPISRSSLNRWIINENKIREECLNLSSSSKGKTKTRRSHNPLTSRLLKAIESSNVMKCLKMYYIQLLQFQPDSIPSDRELREKYTEIKELLGTTETDPVFDEEMWPQIFIQYLEPQVDSIKQDLAQQKDIQRKSKSLLAERRRIRETLQDFSLCDIYQFNEVLFDINNLYDLTDFKNEKIYLNPVDNVNLTGDVRNNKIISLGLCCNLNGSDFIEPLIVSNLTNSKNFYNTTSLSYYYFNPEGLNTREIFRIFLTRWNTKLSIEKRNVALVLDTYSCHFGLMSEFSNIKLVFVNSKFDKTTSYYHKTQVKLPFSFGFERLVKYKLKLSLFKNFYKRKIPLNAFDGIDIINNLKTNYNSLIEEFKNEKYLFFLQLGVTASRIIENIESSDDFEHDDLSTQFNEGNIENYGSQLIEHKSKDKSTHKLSNYINSLIPEKYNSILFSEVNKVVIFKDEEKVLLDFAKTIARAIIESNPGEELNQRLLQHNILREFTVGHNEKKYNQAYSLPGIVKYYELELEHEKSLGSSTKPKDVLFDFKQELKIDNFLLSTVQPFLTRYSNRLVTSNEGRSQSSSADICVTPETVDLFNKFYISYLNDTTVIKPQLNSGHKRSLQFNGSESKRYKLKELISDDDNSDSESELDSNSLQRKNSIISSQSVQSSRYRDTFSDSD